MGGDRGPVTVVQGAIDAIQQNPELTVLVVGDEQRIRSALAKHKFDPQRIEVHPAAEEITMHDSPGAALRQKKQSSIHVANQLVKEGAADAVFTAGNTGAAMAVSLMVLGRIPGVIRPALLINLPSLSPHGETSLLDVGANVDSKPKMLAQFAVMGDLYFRDYLNVPNPRVGLLSVGEEDSKGNDLIHESRDLIKSLKDVNFVGNVEGQDLMNGHCDVVVCDGFIGNVLLKFAEGAIRSIGDILKREVMASNWRTKLGVAFLIPSLKDITRRLDYKEYGSAPLLGINGISTIGHGKSNSQAIKNAILQSAKFVTKHINTKIENALIANGVAE